MPRIRRTIFLLLTMLLLFLSAIAITGTTSITMSKPITHTVLFQTKSKPDDVNAIIEQFFALKEKCVDPGTQKPYILSIKGGKDNSPEGMQNGITHAFVVEFSCAKDRDYYVSKDPAHKDLIKNAGSLLEKLIVVDFADGVY